MSGHLSGIHELREQTSLVLAHVDEIFNFSITRAFTAVDLPSTNFCTMDA
jgi:hypothetical protein